MKIRLMLSLLAILVLLQVKNLNKEIPIVEEIVLEDIQDEPEIVHEIEEFLNAIGRLESNNRYDVVNPYGFMGKYQFSPRTVKYLGFTVSREEFLSNPSLQDEVMMTYLYYNYNALKRYITRYNDTYHKGIYITTSSILAGAHFAGAQGVKSFFISTDSTGTTDSNGMTLRKYMRQFSGYHLDRDVIEQGVI